MNFELFLYKDSIVAYLIPHQRIDFKFKINFKFIFICCIIHPCASRRVNPHVKGLGVLLTVVSAYTTCDLSLFGPHVLQSALSLVMKIKNL